MRVRRRGCRRGIQTRVWTLLYSRMQHSFRFQDGTENYYEVLCITQIQYYIFFSNIKFKFLVKYLPWK